MEPHLKNTATTAVPMTIHPHGKIKTGTTRRLITRLIALLVVGAGSLVAWTVTAPPAFATCGFSAIWTNTQEFWYHKGTWCFADSDHPQSHFVWQADGNLVWYIVDCPVWVSSNTYHKGEILKFQTDGNIVIYDKYNNPLWAAGRDPNNSPFHQWFLDYDDFHYPSAPWSSAVIGLTIWSNRLNLQRPFPSTYPNCSST